VNGSPGIDHWGIVARSLRIAWRHKLLWAFGFFVSMSGGNVVTWVREGSPSVREYLVPRLEALAAVVAGLVVLWLALFVMNLLSRGALIRATGDSDRGLPVSFETAWVAGVRAFLGMLVLALVMMVLFLAGTVVCVLPVVLPLAAGAAGIAIAVVVGAVLLAPYLAFLFALAFTITFAERALVLDDASVADALRIGWRTARERFWTALVAWLVTLLVSIVYGIALVLALLIVAVPFILVWLANHTAGLVLGIPVGVVLVVIATGALGTYQYAFWTLVYQALRGSPNGRADAASTPGTGRDRSPEDLLAGSI
jgi:hypothetical protein